MRSTLAMLVTVAWTGSAWCAEPFRPAEVEAVPVLRRFVTEHEGTFAGRKLRYSVVAGDTHVYDEDGKITASMFTFSYLERGARAEQRPVTFVFNGGPGSSSVWLHLGFVGPRRVAMDDSVAYRSAPFALEDNPDSLLAVSDLVFIDPISTGFSHARRPGAAKDFHGDLEDAESIAVFIQQWLGEHGRWNSPKFLMGESHGTVRASLLTSALMGGHAQGTTRGISLNGLIMVGHDGGLTPLDHDIRHFTDLTTQAAVAWYHGKVDKAGRTFEEFIGQARRFAMDELAPALDARSQTRLTAEDKMALAGRMASFNGLDVGYILANDLRVTSPGFSQALLGPQGMNVGLYDGRATLPRMPVTHGVLTLGQTLGDIVADDPSLGAMAPPFAAALNVYVRQELGVDTQEVYVLSRGLGTKGWRFAGREVPGDMLVNAMRRNPQLRVMFAEGWYDLAAGAVGAAEYGVLRLPTDRASVKRYPGGHMCYLGESRQAMAADVRAFVSAAE